MPRPPRLRADIEKSLVVVLAAVLVFAGVFLLWWQFTPKSPRTPPARGKTAGAPAPESKTPATDPKRPRAPEPAAARGLSAAEKAARVEKIKRDYDEIRAKASADYAAAGTSFPGGLHAFLKQLALLEREKRGDLAAVLSPRELEDLELRETAAGQAVARWLGDTKATEEQRRAVFRLQREFEDQFALTFDLTPKALLERETERQQTQEQVRTELGDELFADWLRAEGADYEKFQRFAREQGLPPETALNLWRAKNEFVLRKLELAEEGARLRLPAERVRTAQAAVAQRTETRVMSIVGAGNMPAARETILGWLPRW